jgi:hypothetical protein
MPERQLWFGGECRWNRLRPTPERQGADQTANGSDLDDRKRIIHNSGSEGFGGGRVPCLPFANGLVVLSASHGRDMPPHGPKAVAC